MPGPGNQKKQNKKTKNKTENKPSAEQPQSTLQIPSFSQYQTLEEDEMTCCNQPATDGFPKKERCRKHQAQYRTMYKKYKDASKIVDELKNDIPDQAQIDQYNDASSLLKKSRMIRKYVEAIRVERTGRLLHQTRFFLKGAHSVLFRCGSVCLQLRLSVDDGHKMRVKVLAKEIERGIKSLNALQARAYKLHIAEKPFSPGWVEEPGLDALDMDKPTAATWDAESPTTISQLVTAASVQEAQTYDTEEEEKDIIDLKLRREKADILSCFEPFLDLNCMISIQLKELGLTDSEKRDNIETVKDKVKTSQMIALQYIRRIVFHDPVLFMKAQGKVCFEDLLLSEDFFFEDMINFFPILTSPLTFGMRWYKDAVVEALAIRDAGTAANVGAPADRFQILGGWIFNRTHLRKTSNEAWHLILTSLNPPADIENRFVRLCNTYDDLIGILSHGAFGLYPHPSFCQSEHGNAVLYRNHLSLAGVVICDMVSAEKPPHLCGPFPSTHRPRQPGCIVWAELQSRSYIFGALRDKPDTFQEAFLNELRARPDLFQVVTRCESDPPRLVKTFGNGENEALPHIRTQKFEAPPASPQNRPRGLGQWEVQRSAVDVLYGTEDALGGYLVTTKNWPGEKKNTTYFFRHKTFPVTYIVILDTTPNRHYTFLAQQVAWAALRAKGYGKGVYEPRKYNIASDKLFEDCAKERLSWMPEGSWHATKMADST